MTGIDSSEVILLLIIGLIVLGPKRLPEIANKVGGWLGQARRMTRVMKRQLEEELAVHGRPDEAPRSIAPPAVVAGEEADGKPVAATEAEAEPEAHVPNDDDTFSPLHGDEPEADDAARDKPA